MTSALPTAGRPGRRPSRAGALVHALVLATGLLVVATGPARAGGIGASDLDHGALTEALLPRIGMDVLPAGARFLASATSPTECPALLRHSYQRLQGGEAQSLCDFRGKVLLVVNTASQCGYTSQYEGLEALYRKYRDRGLVIVGFPSNDFGGQEPGNNREIAEFCRTAYGIAFPMFEKTSIASLAGNTLFAELAARSGERPRWNFHKYLVDRRGDKVRSFPSAVEPGSRELVQAIERLLAEPPAGVRG
jgi:glutathione peroxidase